MVSGVTRSLLVLVSLTGIGAVHASAAPGIDAVNMLRVNAGLPPLARSSTLARAASAHARYLDSHHAPGDSAAGLSAHAQQPGRAGFTGETPQQRALAAGYPHTDVLENVSMGYDSPGEALDGLMSAIYHRLTFLDLEADEIGMATSENARVFLLGRGDLRGVCGDPPAEARFRTPVDCLGQAMTREHYDALCASLPDDARFVAPHPVKCPNGQRLQADFMARLCRQLPPEAALRGHGRYYLPCGDEGPRIAAAWFDRLCEAPPAAAAYRDSGRYYRLCEPGQEVREAWLQHHCETLPESARYRESGLYRRPCAAPHDLRVEYLDALDAARRAALPEVVTWPADGMQDVPPAFFVEEPDPLPDLEVSGYPVSIQFNPAHGEAVEVRRFELWELVGDGVVAVAETRRLDAASDPHGLLGQHEFALFPIRRLAWGGDYEVRVEAVVDGVKRQYDWRFRVAGAGHPLLTADSRLQRFVVDPGVTYLLYLPPLEGAPHTVLRTRTEHLRGNRVSVEVVDPNTLKLSIEARYCDRMSIVVDDGRVVELVPAGCPG